MFTMGAGLDKLGEKLLKEQEIMGRLADLAIWSYAMESAYLRAQKAVQKKGERAGGFKVKLADAFVYNTMEKLGLTAVQVLASVATGDDFVKLREDLGQLTKYKPIDSIALNREIALKISENGRYVV